MSLSTKDRGLGLPQFVLIIILGVGVFLAWDFGRHVFETIQLSQADARADLQLRQAQDTNGKLIALKSDVETDDWVEKYARTNWHWTRENETIFVPAATPVSTPAPARAAAPAPPPPKPFWEEWLDALFGPSQ
jgi:cell division protein DivIC